MYLALRTQQYFLAYRASWSLTLAENIQQMLAKLNRSHRFLALAQHR